MKGPFVFPALALMAGILIGDCLDAPLPVLFAAGFLLAIGCLTGRAAAQRWLWALLIVFGWTNLACRTAVLSPHDVRVILDDQHEIVRLRGTLASEPRSLISERDGKAFRHSLAMVELDAIARRGESVPARGRVVAHTPAWLDAGFHAGRRVELTGVIGPPKGPAAEGLFDYREHLRRRGVYFTVDVEGPGDWTTTDDGGGPGRPRAVRFRDWAQTCLARGLPEEDDTVRLLWAISLGWKTALTDEVAEPFMRSGTIHLFAVSGLHVGMISMILVGLLRSLALPPVWRGGLTIASLIFFCAVTGHHSSTVRATIMMSVVIAGWSLERPVDLLNSLAGAAFIILTWEPRQLFHAGFQLSFFVVLAIALLLPRFERWREALLSPDLFLPPELRPGWRRWLDGPARWLSLNLCVSLAAWLGSAPLIACYFHLFTPVSLLANLLIVPLAAPTLAACLGSFICGDWLAPAGELFNHCAWFAMWLMEGLSGWAADLPGAWRHVAAPPIHAMALYYLALFTALNLDRIEDARRRSWALTGMTLAACLSVATLIRPAPSRITVLALHGGGAIHADPSGRSNDLVIDCGDASGVRAVLTPFLQARGEDTIPRAILTHGDAGQVGGFESLAATLPVERVFFNPAPSHSPVYRRIVDGLPPGCGRAVSRGDRIGDWEVLHPAADDRFPRGDDNALALRGEIEGVRILLLSDLGDEGQRALFERTEDLRADIVIAGLPESGAALKNGLLAAIRPRLILVADTRPGGVGRADDALRSRLALQPARVLYTSDCGSTTLEIQDGTCRLSTMTGAGAEQIF